MHIVYRARRLADAHTACSLLATHGIDSHIADPTPQKDTDVILVCVDNRTFDKARRALRDWAAGQDLSHSTERSAT